ncbi:MAG: hypothetical protein IPK78_03085 [Rhodospirillales bacterium]|nr:hypothetical protein [Rhodospirillales bacterium]
MLVSLMPLDREALVWPELEQMNRPGIPGVGLLLMVMRASRQEKAQRRRSET